MAFVWNPDTQTLEDDGQGDPDTDPTLFGTPTTAPATGGNADLAALHTDTGYAGGSDEDVARMIADAKASGVTPSLIDRIVSGANGAGKSVTDWIKANPELAKILGTGMSTAQSQANRREELAQANQYRIDAENAKNAHDQLLRDQRNASVVGTHAADLSRMGAGIINSALYKR